MMTLSANAAAVALDPQLIELQILQYETSKVGAAEAARRKLHRKIEKNEHGDLIVYERGWRTLWIWEVARMMMVDGTTREFKPSILGKV